MSTSIRTLALAASFALALAPLALAGGSMVSVEGPFKGGAYVVHAYTCGGAANLRVTAHAEGVVNGQRRSLPLQLTAMKTLGVYTFERTWPAEGSWVLRLELADGHGPTTVAAVSRDGRVGENEHLRDTDGKRECDRKLAVNAK